MKIHSLNITPELLQLITQIDEFKGSWNSLHSLTPEILKTLRHVATIESIGSSTRIEGVKMTNEEIEVLLGNLDQKSFRTRDEQEVAGYAEVMETIFQNHAEILLTENYLKQFHASLLRYSTKDERHRGQYKTLDNHVEAFNPDGTSRGVVFQTETPFNTPEKMRLLMLWVRETLEDNSIHPLLAIGIFNVVFLAIHPFQDGNGRLSRVIVTLLLLKSGYSYVPYSSLESIIEGSKDRYYLALRSTQKTLEEENPDWLPWLIFFLRSLNAQKVHLETKMTQGHVRADLPSDSVIILEYLEKHGRITMKQADDITDTPRATLKLRFNALIKDGLIQRKGQGRGTWYIKKM